MWVWKGEVGAVTHCHSTWLGIRGSLVQNLSHPGKLWPRVLILQMYLFTFLVSALVAPYPRVPSNSPKFQSGSQDHLGEANK